MIACLRIELWRLGAHCAQYATNCLHGFGAICSLKIEILMPHNHLAIQATMGTISDTTSAL